MWKVPGCVEELVVEKAFAGVCHAAGEADESEEVGWTAVGVGVGDGMSEGIEVVGETVAIRAEVADGGMAAGKRVKDGRSERWEKKLDPTGAAGADHKVGEVAFAFRFPDTIPVAHIAVLTRAGLLVLFDGHEVWDELDAC